jgi:predicted phage terminase large subunit-like protein
MDDDDIWSLDSEAELLALLQADMSAETLTEFINRVSPNLPPPDHIKKIIRLIEATRNKEVRATISMPPRHVKTQTGIHGLAWRIQVDPTKKNAFCSYSADLAYEKSREIRQKAIEGGAMIAQDNRKVAGWATVFGGGLVAAGVGGPITGKGIDGVLWIDDPFKNREEADSATMRDKVWNWFRGAAFTRLEAGGSIIVVQTRWHRDDLIGRIKSEIDDGSWQHISVPAVTDKHGLAADERILDANGRPAKGEFRQDVKALWPSNFPLKKLEEIRRSIGEYEWWAQYQQSPIPMGSNIFNPIPSRFLLSDFKLTGHRLIMAVDPAATASTRADHSVACIMAADGYGDQMRCWMLDVLRAQVTIPELVRRLDALQQKWNVAIAVEAVAAFKAVPDMLREIRPGIPILNIQPKGDKFTRAQPYAAAWNDGRVFVPTDAHWANAWISEHAEFTGTDKGHDDQVDAGTHGFTTLFRLPPRAGQRNYDFVNPF